MTDDSLYYRVLWGPVDRPTIARSKYGQWWMVTAPDEERGEFDTWEDAVMSTVVESD